MTSPFFLFTAFSMQNGGRVLSESGSVRSRLVERKSFPLSNFQLDPVHRVLVYLSILPVKSNSWLGQVELRLQEVSALHRIHCGEKYCLSPFLLIFPPAISAVRTIECKSVKLPTWYMYSVKSFGNTTRSCRKGSIWFPPE